MLKLTPEFWTDGSCHPNPGNGGWAVVDHLGRLVADGHARNATNITMEGMAILAAIHHMHGAKGTIWTDSEHWVKTCTTWAKRWEREGWQDRPNLDLTKNIYGHYLTSGVSLQWLRGHAGDPQNEAADRYAKAARKRASQPGYDFNPSTLGKPRRS